LVRDRALIGLAVAAFLGGMAGAPLQALFPVYVEAELRQRPLVSAELRTALLLLGGLFALPGGALCDRMGRRRTFLIGLTGAVAAGGVFLARDPALLLLLCGYVGLMSGFQTTGGQSYMMAAVPRERLGMASALYFQSGTLGIALGSRLGGPVADAHGFGALGRGMIAVAAAVVLAAAFFLPDAAPVAGRRSFALGPLLAAYRGILRLPRVRLLLLLRYLPTCYWGAATLVLPLLIFRLTGTKSAAALYAAVSLLVAAVCQVLTGRWCDRAGLHRPVRVAAAGVAISAALTALFAGSLVGLYVFGIAGAAAAWSLSTTMPGIIHDVAPEGEQGTVVGAAHLAWSAGMLSGSLGGGALVEWRPGGPFAVTALLCAAACVVAARLMAMMAVCSGASDGKRA
jgi:MFS family permease